MNLDNSPLTLGDTVYHRRSGQYGKVISLSGTGAAARFATLGDVYFDGGGNVGTAREIGWGAPVELWPERSLSTVQREQFIKVMSAALDLAKAFRT